MRTTLDIDDGLLRQAKSFAAQEHISLTRLIEESFHCACEQHKPATPARVARFAGLCRLWRFAPDDTWQLEPARLTQCCR